MNNIKVLIINFIYDNFYPWFFQLVYIRDKNRIHRVHGEQKNFQKNKEMKITSY
jgi:hypothetical protein